MKQSTSRFKRICVFCGSSQGRKTSYHDAAIDLAKELVSRDIDLVYGGGSLGLMGLVSHTVHSGGRHVIGVIPRALITSPKTIGETVGEVMPVEDMHQRKAEMARQSDAFVALPGGYGTLEELFEMTTWAQLAIHHKPVGLLNVDGYYDSLLAFIDKAVKEGFISPSARRIIVQAPSAQELLEKLEEYVPYYDVVASGLDWEMKILEGAGDDAGISVSSPPQEKPKPIILCAVKEDPGPLTDQDLSGIAEAETRQPVSASHWGEAGAEKVVAEEVIQQNQEMMPTAAAVTK